MGRESELALVCERVLERRLVTLVGPGGIGKTTLAREVAARSHQSFGDGALTVDLTLVDSSAGVRESLADQLGYSSFRAMLDAPGDRPVLIVVDNCEHVVEEVADAVDELLVACEMPTVLATSRSALELPDESVVLVGPLAVPVPGQLDAPAVALFLDRARDAGVDLEPTEAVAELCRRLDGVPLAIELAAARCRSMTPEDILDRLGAGLDVLARPRRRSDPRHQSLRAAIDWSYALLPEDEQRLFRAVSVFSGPFTADAARALSGAGTAAVGATLDGLDALVAASMVVVDRDGPTTRYRLLETIRAHGLAELDGRGERGEHERRLVDHTVERANEILARGSTTWSSSALADLLEIYGDIAAAVRWCVDHDDEPDRALLLVALLWGVVHQAHTEDVGRLARAALARWPDTPHPMRADAVATATTCQYMLGDLHGAIEAAEEALALDPHSPFAPATLRRVVAQARRAAGDAEGAIAAFDATARVARELGVTAMATEADAARAQILADVGRIDEALALVRDAQGEARTVGSEIGTTWARAVEGSILLRSDPEAAVRLLDHVLVEAREIRYHAAVSVALRARALAALRLGDCVHAAERSLELLDALLAMRSTAELRAVLDVASPTLAACGRTRGAADLAATALAMPVVSITASVGHELFPLDPGGGSVLSPREAILRTRAELLAVLDEPRSVVDLREASAPASLDGPAPTGGVAVARDRRTRTGTFRRTGELWEVGLDGSTVTARGSKGMQDLHRLLGSPGREIHALELVGSPVDESGTGPQLDPAARRAYEERVRELQGEIDEADRHHDLARAERARVELDALVDELAAALGLGGRARTTAGSSAERARSTVTQRVRSTIRRLEEVHPALGRHLRASVRTGAFCAYSPESPTTWEL